MEHTDFGEKVIHKKEDLWRDLKGHREWAYGAQMPVLKWDGVFEQEWVDLVKAPIKKE